MEGPLCTPKKGRVSAQGSGNAFVWRGGTQVSVTQARLPASLSTVLKASQSGNVKGLAWIQAHDET